jgi:hypothetical protein
MIWNHDAGRSGDQGVSSELQRCTKSFKIGPKVQRSAAPIFRKFPIKEKLLGVSTCGQLKFIPQGLLWCTEYVGLVSGYSALLITKF